MGSHGGGTTTYLVEGYERRGATALDDLEARCRAAAEGFEGVRYLRSILVPEDETCFHLFEGPSEEAVRKAGTVAGLTPVRVVACLASAAKGPGNGPSRPRGG
ncbi:MAG: nickel-binding protein [Gaiellaceae bacterium]